MSDSLARLRSSVRQAVGNPPLSILTLDELDTRINRAYFKVLRLFPPNRLKRDTTVTTSSGSNENVKPGDYWFARVVKDETNDQRLVYRRLEWIEERDDGSSTGQPEYWTVEDENFRWYPTPDGSYTIRIWYVARPNLLSDPTDKTALEFEFDELVELDAIQRVFFIMGDYDRHVHTLNLFRHEASTMIVDDEEDAATGAQIIGRMTDITDVTS